MLFLKVLHLLTFCALLHARETKGPTIKNTTLDHPVSNLFYFEDSDIVLIHDREAGKVLRSDNAGETWDDVDDIKKGAAWDVWQHPHDDQTAYVLGGDRKHWKTEDRGKNWKSFETEAPPSLFRQPPFSWHANQTEKVLFHGQICKGIFACQEVTYYTTDGFENTKRMRADTRGCTFARSTPLFQSKHEDTVLCVVTGKYSPWPKDQRLVVSDDYFKTEKEPELESGRTVQGIISVAPVKGFIVAAAKAEGTRELAMYVTKDASTWHRAEFPSDHKLEEDAYTVLESTNYSIQVDVMTTGPENPMGVLFTSNSNGTYFTRNVEHMNRNRKGIVDFEKIQGIQGIVLVNVVDNWPEVEKSRKDKKVQSQISFDDGRTFTPLKAGDKNLHLHSVTDMSNVGRVFSSVAPGLVLGIGNIGDHLMDYEDGDLWVSGDAGVSWKKALDEAHKYEFGDQGSVLVAIYDEGPTDKIQYSLDHGTEWHEADLGEKVRAKVLTTVPDSTTLKFILVATTGRGSKLKNLVISIDFNSLEKDKCDDEAFEKWCARLDEKGKPDCLMGHKQYYKRRIADKDCFVMEKFKEELAQFERCKCTEEDYECDYNFKPSEDGKKCVPAGVLPVPKDVCKGDDESFKGPSGYRLIPGNACDPEGGLNLDKEQERECKETKGAPVSGKISHEVTSFKASSFHESYYFERAESSTGDDETVIMRTSENKIYITKDHGKTWDHLLKDKKEEITAIYPNKYFNDWVFFLTPSKKVYYSRDRGVTIHDFEVESEPNHDQLPVLSFHPTNDNWFIWTGAADCKTETGCHSDAFITKDRGGHWGDLLRYVRKCEFIKEEGRGGSEELVYCEQYKDERLDQPLQLVSSEDWFAKTPDPIFTSVVDFATMSEFIIVAAKDHRDDKSLKVDTSVDGKTFADAEWPANFKVPVQRAYTVLDSSTHAVFLHVTVGSREDFEYGSIVKSNSNGTSYVLSLDGVNRNKDGYVDFEKMLGLEGVALVNVVDNINAADEGQRKKLKTMITHNDGGEWAPLKAPQQDSEEHNFDCDVDNVKECSLHLHSYTERKDPRDTFSSPTAIGLMMGVGNVGEYLGKKVDEDTISTFITRDGGVEWQAVKKGKFMWEYGDQGSIIVIVQEKVATDVIFYSLDEGRNWIDYKFTDAPMEIESITTVPSDTSRNFLLWGRFASKGSEVSTVNLDFSGLEERSKQCDFDSENPASTTHDYELWSPKHPLSPDKCLFGHEAQYVRKKIDAKCYNGPKLPKLSNILQNCTCTRQDFECDYNYERDSAGTCQLVEGLDPPNHEEQCKKNPKQTHYYKPTGYRRIPLDTCQGGRDLAQWESNVEPCPGREADFEKEKAAQGLSGFWFFILVVLLPFAGAGAVGYWVYNNWGDGMKVGSIRLGGGSSSGTDESPWIKYPVAILAGTVAVVAAIPLLVTSLWRSVSGLWGGGRGRYSGLGEGRAYTTRNSFARGRGEYAVVDPDEDELLGEDEDEDA